MAKKSHELKPKRLTTGRLTQLKPYRLTPEGRQRLRESTLRHKPWKHATGPKTPEGKARAAQNGRYRQHGELSRRQLEREMAEVGSVLAGLVAIRQMLLKQA